MPESNLKKEPNVPKALFDVILLSWIVMLVYASVHLTQVETMPYSKFLNELQQGHLSEIVVRDKYITGFIGEGKSRKQFNTVIVNTNLAEQLAKSKVTFAAAAPEPWFASALGWVLGILVVFFIASRFARNSEGTGLSPGLLPIERSGAKIYAEKEIKISFNDVAGVDEAKEELQEVIKFLKEPKSYSRLGARLPKGVLLVGPPGTGKTLLARAVAGETGVPFFSISGSEFVELFVGVGAARVRDLFVQARSHAPCILFIDELDALGRSRSGTNWPGAHDEKEQTLNQLLVELDGFDPSIGVVVLAATNRPEVLDEALLRAGRFDRQVVVDRPDRRGRVEILQVHLKKIISAGDLDVEQIAALTPGLTGADLANVVNEAALLAARRGADVVESKDFENAIERGLAGLEKKNRLLNRTERERVAIHEMGHAIVTMQLPGTENVQKVSIIPRGVAALGYTVRRPNEERFLLTRAEIMNQISALLGGRAAESLFFDEPSTGCADDLQKASQLARAVVTRYGMNDTIGLVVHQEMTSPFLPMNAELSGSVSPDTAREIDCAVRETLRAAYDSARGILLTQRDWLNICAQHLLEEETLSVDQINALKPVSVTIA